MSKKMCKSRRVFVFFFIFSICIFGFTVPIALGSSWPAASNLSQNNTDSVYPSIAADLHGNLHMVWRDTDGSGNQEIYYRKFSAVNGSWGTARDISNTPNVSPTNTGNSDEPSVAADKYGNVHVVWMDYLNGNMEIYYVKYDNASGSWGTRMNISNSLLSLSQSPSIASDPLGNVYAVWADGGDIYYARNVGGIWSSPQLLSNNAEADQKPKVTVDSNGGVSVVWQGEILRYKPPQGEPVWNSEIFYRYSPNGTSWPGDMLQQLSYSSINSPTNSLSPAVTTDINNNIYVVWESLGEIYSRKSSNGLSWDSLMNLSNTATASNQPSIAGDRIGNVHLVWSEYIGNWEIYYKEFSGSSWSTYTNISNTTTSVSRTPTIVADATANPKAVWEDGATAFDIYYSGLSGPVVIHTTGFEESSLPGWSFGDEDSSSGGLDYWGRTNITGAANTGSYGLWCAAVGTNSTASEQPNTTVRKYDKGMGAFAKLSVDLTLYQSASLTVYYKVPSIEGFNPPGDMGWLYVRDLSGNPLGSALGQYSTVVSSWQSQTFDLSQFTGQPVVLDWRWVSDLDDSVAEGMYIDDITVTGMPLSIVGVNPNVRSNDKAYKITITGTGFKPTPTVTIGTAPASSVTRVDATKLTATVPAGLPYGTYSVTVTNPGGATATLYYGYKVSIEGDITGDGLVDIDDLFIVARAFGSSEGSPNWDVRADLYPDGYIDIDDLFIVARNFGRSL